MQTLSLDSATPVILCLGAHSDDIEIGCGATLLRLLDALPGASVRWVVFSTHGERATEARHGADLFAGDRLAGFDTHDFRDGFFPETFGELKERFRDLARAVEPDLILTHWRRDAHQDHRLVAELTWQTFRDHFILEYEIPKYDGDLGSPNVYLPVAREQADRKVAHLMEAFPSQHAKYWFNEETLRSLMTIRGVECKSSSGFAEAFHGYKVVLNAGERD
ncbi:MAG: PIG-L family deacetylase [Gammaproteobacteria bacterium]|nr:PIG-L family deacetylase [Gammaproteobacteria bacterium]